jgi:hypothetical protein
VFDWRSRLGLRQAERMPKTIAELADRLYVAPGDIETVLSTYPDDVEDLWSEEGVLSDLACDDLDRMLNPYGVRTAPELFPTLPVGVVMISRRVARVAGDNLMLWPRRSPIRARIAPMVAVLGRVWTDSTAAQRTSREP